MSFKKPIRDTHAEAHQMYRGFLQSRAEQLSGKSATIKVPVKPMSQQIMRPVISERKVQEKKVQEKKISSDPQVQREYMQAPVLVRTVQAPRQVPTVQRQAPQNNDDIVLQKAIEASLKDEKRRQVITADEALAQQLALEAYSA